MSIKCLAAESKQDIQQIKRLGLHTLFHEFPRFVDALAQRIRRGVDKFPFIVIGRVPGLVEPLIEPFSLSGVLQLAQLLRFNGAQIKAIESKAIESNLCAPWRRRCFCWCWTTRRA